MLEGLEKVADYCDKLDIALVKINDLELVGAVFFNCPHPIPNILGDRVQSGRAASVGVLSEHHPHPV